VPFSYGSNDAPAAFAMFAVIRRALLIQINVWLVSPHNFCHVSPFLRPANMCNTATSTRLLALAAMVMALVLVGQDSIRAAETQKERAAAVLAGISTAHILTALKVCPHLSFNDRHLKRHLAQIALMGVHHDDPLFKKVAEQEGERILKAAKEGDAKVIDEVCSTAKRYKAYLEQW
jgi:hypothetical protein